VPIGFVLQPTYRIESGRPVVHLWGKLEDGRSFLVRDRRQVPRFWIRSRDAEAARERGARIAPDDRERVDMSGNPVVPVEVDVPPDVPPVRERLSAAGIPTFEADVRFAIRYLVDRGVRGSCEIVGEERPGEGVDVVFEDPEVRAAGGTLRLSVLSIDIETDPRAERLLSVALVGGGADEVLLLAPPDEAPPEGSVACGSERELLQRFVQRVREIDPDVLTGWNLVDFDLTVLADLATRRGVRLAIGRGREPLRLRPSSSPRVQREAQVPGRVVLDGIELVRGAFLRYESFSLDSVSREVLGEAKTMTGPGRADAIFEAWRTDRARFVEYNRNDARLVLGILEKLRLVELAVERSLLTGLPPNRVAASVASFDFLYLTELGKRGVVAPTAGEPDRPMPQTGGTVFEPESGLHENVVVLDFKSLYPSIIRTFNIDPWGRAREGSARSDAVPEADPAVAPDAESDPVVAPNGVRFRREPGILPGILDELFPRREKAKSGGDDVASQAIKILMNSFYGVLGTPACRFASPDLANAITGFGRTLLVWSRDRLEAKGFRVLYGDTDSLFVDSAAATAEEARRIGARLVAELNRELAVHVRDTWRVESRLELEFETLYRKLLLPEMRHGAGGARKRYAGLAQIGSESVVVFTGMEVVRRDWTELAKSVQRELYTRLFTDRPVEEYLRDVVARVRAGELDDLLVYRKGLRKRLEAYTASTPPHVAAARKMKGKPGSLIEYVITADGPEPVAERTSPIDREHYVQKQVRPVAEPVIAILELDFDVIVGDDRQLDLF
jgi:DNA polymerase-2